MWRILVVEFVELYPVSRNIDLYVEAGSLYSKEPEQFWMSQREYLRQPVY
jgi:hypothetical protein